MISEKPSSPEDGLVRTAAEAVALLTRAWPLIVEECRAVLGGEQHYQAVVYHCLRTSGLHRSQLGMNVKQRIVNPTTILFQALDKRKHPDFQGGFEPIPDIAIFRPEIVGDWRRHRHDQTLTNILVAIEMKASERHEGRLRSGEVIRDIHKLAAHRDEVRHRGSDMHPIMLVIDTAPLLTGRMRPTALEQSKAAAAAHGVSFFYLSPDTNDVVLAKNFTPMTVPLLGERPASDIGTDLHPACGE